MIIIIRMLFASSGETDYSNDLVLYALSPVKNNINILGPVVQSVVSLTSSLRVISLTVLADSIHHILIFFAEKMWVAFFCKKLQNICVSLDVNFNESLTNDIVSFEQLGPEWSGLVKRKRASIRQNLQ